MEVKRIFDVVEHALINFPKEDALAGKSNGIWIKYSTQDYKNYADNLSYAFLALGIKKGDKIASVSNNRPEWNFLDIAIMQVGAVHVPIYPTISEEEYEYIFAHSDTKMVFISDQLLLKKLNPIIQKCPNSIDVYTFNEVKHAKNWTSLLELGKKSAVYYSSELEAIKASIQPQDLASIIYTSGTTGLSKGVMLSHHNLVTNFIGTSGAHQFGKDHRVLSFLPLSHVYERMMNYHFQYKGMGIYYAENIGTIAENLNQTVLNFKKTSDGLTGVDTIMNKINVTAGNAAIISKQLTDMMYNINEGNGTLGRLIRDTILAENLNQTLINLKKGSKGLDENMNAAKENFLCRRYFERKAKEAATKKKLLKNKTNK